MSGAYWTIGGMLASLIAGYAVGWQHGHDRASLDIKAGKEVIVAPYPFSGACDAMLEAAWSVQPAPSSSPHE